MSLLPLSRAARAARVVTVAGTAVALIAGGGVLSAVAANASTPGTVTVSAASASAAASAAPSASHVKLAIPARALTPATLRELTGKLPASLKADFKALKGKKGSARQEAVATIETKALDGGYGSSIKSVATKAEAAWKAAPAALKADLKTLKGEDRAARVAELKTIETKALDGHYGTTIETYAKELKAQAAARAAEAAAPVLGSMV
jgi:hypothetical protein